MKCFRHVVIFLLSGIACMAIAEDSNGDIPMRSVQQGQVQGKLMTSGQGKPFEAYLGIPYGKVKRRFTSPEPAEPWTGVHDGTKDGPACKQNDMFFRKAMHGQEDCLTVNVYTPKRSSNDNSTSLMPVLVFIYGGAFLIGEATSTIYGPSQLMNYPIVLVLMNYRVGGFGFLSTEDEAAPGNFGLQDQVLALQWVQNNIASFGGDPQRVTISGESAGAGSVAFHLLSPLSKGLFHGAIAQSGATLCPWSIQENSLNITKSIAEKLNCTTASNAGMIECLQSVDADELLLAENDTSRFPLSLSHSFGPVVEDAKKGGKFLTEDPLKLLTEGRFNKVPVISGLVAYETAASIPLLEAFDLLPSPKNLEDKNLDTVITNLVDWHQQNHKINHSAIKEVYFKNVNFSSETEVHLKEVDLSSDIMFRSCNDKTVKLLSAGGIPVYMYVFDYATKELSATNFSGKPDASHGIELFFLFNLTLGELGKNAPAEAKAFGKRFLDLWINFVKEGNPTPSGLVLWKPTPPGGIAYLNITENMAMVDGYYTKEMQYWDDHLYNIKKD